MLASEHQFQHTWTHLKVSGTLVPAGAMWVKELRSNAIASEDTRPSSRAVNIPCHAKSELNATDWTVCSAAHRAELEVGPFLPLERCAVQVVPQFSTIPVLPAIPAKHDPDQ